MTANSPTADIPTSPVAAQPGRARSAIWEWSDARVFPILLVALFGMYGLLQNPYWVPAGDSELYAAAARSLAQGKGYTFLGQPVAISPPGWSYMMAAVMKVTSYVWPLKLMAMVCMIASLAIGYWICRRYVSPVPAAAVIVLTAILSHVYQATYWLISEGSFCLATSASILLAMQIAEGRRQWWRVALLLFCCCAAVTIRWAGVIGIMLVVAALLDRQWKPRLATPWITSVLVVLVTILTFFGWRYGLRGTPEQVAAAADMVTGTGEDLGPLPTAEVGPPVVGTASQNAKVYQLFPPGSYADRFLNWGRWFSLLYWQPFRAAGAKWWILAAASVSGWIVIASLAVIVVAATLRRRWLWIATLTYTGALAMGWPNVNARYFVPIAFLITLGIFLASDELTALAERRPGWRKVIAACFVFFVATVAICNGALYAVEATIARSDRFYSRYETGMNVPLIAACQYLNQQSDSDQVAISPRYTNLNRAKASPFGIRAAVWLTARNDVISPRWRDTAVPPNSSSAAGKNVRKWLRSKGVKWYLYQPEIVPWRVWHFRLTWYQQWQTGLPVDKETPGWTLYRSVTDANGEEDWVAVRMPGKCQPVTRVPRL